jgi:hypothetical protein
MGAGNLQGSAKVAGEQPGAVPKYMKTIDNLKVGNYLSGSEKSYGSLAVG